MASKLYFRQTLSGGTANALDGIDGAILADEDACIVFSGGTVYFYALDVDSALAESSPDTIEPDANAGDKRWLLQDVYGATASGGGEEAPSTKTTGATLTTSELNRTVRMNAATNETITLPDMVADNDGDWVRFIKVGAGNLTVQVGGSAEYIADSTSSQITGTTEYAALEIEYVDAIATWVVRNLTGSWSSA